MPFSLANRRTRHLIFRVTEEEFESLKQLCAARGGRSLSEFARAELLGMAERVNCEARPAWMGILDRRLNLLEAQMAALSEKVGLVPVPEPPQTLDEDLSE